MENVIVAQVAKLFNFSSFLWVPVLDLATHGVCPSPSTCLTILLRHSANSCVPLDRTHTVTTSSLSRPPFVASSMSLQLSLIPYRDDGNTIHHWPGRDCQRITIIPDVISTRLLSGCWPEVSSMASGRLAWHSNLLPFLPKSSYS